MKKNYFIILILIAVILGGYVFFQSDNNIKSPREAINEGISQYKKTNNLSKEDEAKVRIQLAIANHIASYGKPPSSLTELIPKYFDSVPIDPSTKKEFEYALNGSSYKLGTLSQKSEGDKLLAKNEDDFVNPNKIDLGDYVYDPNGKRDPFKPFTDKPETLVDEKTPALLRYDISQFRVAAVLDDSQGGMFAMVEDSAGVGYPVRSGDAIGINNGKVLSIQKDKIEVLETITNAAGETKQELKTIKFVSAGADAKSLKKKSKTKVRVK